MPIRKTLTRKFTPNEFFILDELSKNGSFFDVNNVFRQSLKSLYFSGLVKVENYTINSSFSNVKGVKWVKSSK